MASFFDHAVAPGRLIQEDWNEGDGYALANVFRFGEEGQVSEIWWYAAAPHWRPGEGRIEVRLLDAGRTLLAKGEAPVQSAAEGWQAVTLSQPVNVQPGRVYFAVATAPVDDEGHVHYAIVDGFGAEGGVRGPVAAPSTKELAAEGIVPGNGRFAADPRAFPDQSFEDAGYGIDVTFTPGPPVQRTLHVRHDGDDGGDGSALAPWATLPYAAGRLGPGDTLVVGDGVWDTPFTLSAGGTAAAPIVVRAANRHAAFIDVNAYAAIIVGGHFVEIDGLKVRNYGRHGIEGQYNHHMTVRNCRVHGCGGNGIGALKGDFYTFEDNVCEGNGRTGWNSGISVYEPDHRITGDETTTDRNVFRRNVCIDNHMLAFIDFVEETSEIAIGDDVAIGPVRGRVDRVDVGSGNWADGDAAGRIGLFLAVPPVGAPPEGTAIEVGDVVRARVGGRALYTDEGMFTDGNGIILDDWGWYQNPAEGYAYPFGALVEENVCARNGGKGIQCYGVKGPCLVRNNTVWHNNRDLMQARVMTWRGDLSAQDTAASFVDNIAVADPTPDPNVTAIGVYGGAVRAELTRNLTFDGTPGERSLRVEQASWTGEGNLFGVDPRLADPAAGDFRLLPGSPAIGAAEAGGEGQADLGALQTGRGTR